MKKLAVLFGIVGVLLNGCCSLGTNHFEANYTGTYNDEATTPEVKPEVVLAANKSGYDSEVSLLKSEGATLLGTSFFNVHSYSMCESHLKSWAKKQGADFVVATREYTKETRTMEPREEYVTIYNNEGKSVGGYWHTVMREIVRTYYDYSGSLLKARPLEAIIP